MTAAIAGILSAGTIAVAHAEMTPNPEMGKCMGGNACKGKSACMGAHNKCAGQNACAGKGWTEAKDAQDCETQAKNAKAKHYKFVSAENAKKS